jgi:hypothetical protein
MKFHSMTLPLAALLSLFAACDRPTMAGEREETPTAESDVPVEVQLAAAKLCARLGRASARDWVWDAEDKNWEVAILGLPREAELDLLPDGGFSELELVYTFAEVVRALPEVAGQIQSRCGDTNVRIELSLRRVEHLDALPELAAAWKLDGVVLEFQGEGRGDYELDARGQLLTHPVDDKQ